MITNFDFLIVALVLTNLMLLGSSQLGTCIRTVAVQGVAIGFLPFFLHHEVPAAATVLLAATGIFLKGMVFPWLLFRALRVANVRREIEPFVGYPASLMIGILALACSYWLASRLPLPFPSLSPHLLPVAMFTMMCGMFLIITRRKALTQVVGYLALENGIYVCGVTLLREGTSSLLVELGVLLDMSVAVFVMGIAIFHISREFDHIDTDQMATLRDWTGS